MGCCIIKDLQLAVKLYYELKNNNELQTEWRGEAPRARTSLCHRLPQLNSFSRAIQWLALLLLSLHIHTAHNSFAFTSSYLKFPDILSKSRRNAEWISVICSVQSWSGSECCLILLKFTDNTCVVPLLRSICSLERILFLCLESE